MGEKKKKKKKNTGGRRCEIYPLIAFSVAFSLNLTKHLFLNFFYDDRHKSPLATGFSY